MNIYSIVLFLHIAGTLGFFVTLGLEWTSVRQLRNAVTSEQIHTWMSLSNGTRRLGMASMLTVVIAGIYLTVTAWGGAAWITVSLGAVVLVMALLTALTRPRTAAIGQAVTAEKGPASYRLQNLANDPLLWISIQTRVAISLGIVFLMTVKPGTWASLLTVGVAIVLGIASSLPNMRRKRMQEGTAD